MKNPYARRINRQYYLFLLRVIFLDVPRLHRLKRRAVRRGESTTALNAEIDRIQQELKRKRRLAMKARESDRLLSQAGWQ